MTRRFLPVAAACSLFVAAACTSNSKRPADDTLPPRPVNEQPIAAQQALAALDLKVDLRDNGMLLHIANIPAGSTIECYLDNLPLTPCNDGALLIRPAVGDHRVTAKSLSAGNVTGQGASPTFTVTADAGAVDAEPTSARSLTLAPDPSFVNGATVPMTQNFTAKFKFADQAPCDKPVLKCKYDSPVSPFWTACDSGDASFTIAKGLLAMGLQYLSVQAACAGDVGPTLTMSWWGVPDGYQPLMLNDLKDSNDRHVFNLVKADDCPRAHQKFECAAAATGEFALCTGGNSLDRPASGYRVRMNCDGKTGPVVTIQ